MRDLIVPYLGIQLRGPSPEADYPFRPLDGIDNLGKA
jgi:hypothetical protein